MIRIPKSKVKEAIKTIKNMPAEKSQELTDRITATARNNVIKQILDQKPEWTYEDAVRECTREDPERDPELTMWWKIAPYVTIMKTDKDKRKVRELLDDDEKAVFDKKIMELNVKKQIRKGINKGLKGQGW